MKHEMSGFLDIFISTFYDHRHRRRLLSTISKIAGNVLEINSRGPELTPLQLSEISINQNI